MHTSISLEQQSIRVKPQTKFNCSNGLSLRHLPCTQNSTNTVPTLKVCHRCGLNHRLSDKRQTSICSLYAFPVPYSSMQPPTQAHNNDNSQASCRYLPIKVSPCVCNSEAPLFVDVVVEHHAAKQSRRVARGKAWGDGGGRSPMSSWPLWLQQVLPQDLHQVFIQAGVFGHGGHCQGVLVGHPHACLLGHACPGFTTTTTSTSQEINRKGRQDMSELMQNTHLMYASSLCKSTDFLKI